MLFGVFAERFFLIRGVLAGKVERLYLGSFGRDEILSHADGGVLRRVLFAQAHSEAVVTAAGFGYRRLEDALIELSVGQNGGADCGNLLQNAVLDAEINGLLRGVQRIKYLIHKLYLPAIFRGPFIYIIPVTAHTVYEKHAPDREVGGSRALRRRGRLTFIRSIDFESGIGLCPGDFKGLQVNHSIS